MKILNAIKNDGKIVGYMIEDGSYNLPMCSRSLYVDMYIQALTESGYKFYSYNADEITDENGEPISNLPAINQADVDDVEWFSSEDLANTSALSDSEASKYYSFKTTTMVEFRKESSYEINTREEFLLYLKHVESGIYASGFVGDHRPINFFVNPDVLFTIQELNDNPELKTYFATIIKRHKFRNYKAYTDLCVWLMEKGVLNNATPTPAEFLNAYYAWGPEGIKDNCTKFETKLNVDGIFDFPNDPLMSTDAEAYAYDNRQAKVAIFDTNNTLHHLKVHQDISQFNDIINFGRARILVSNDIRMGLRDAKFNGKKFLPVAKTLLSDVSDRLYFNLMADNGYTYTYKVSHDHLIIGLTFSDTNRAVVSYANNFSFSTIVPSTSIPFDIVNSENDYYFWNLAIFKASQIIQSKTVVPPVNSTTEFLLKDGVNPVATVDYIANTIAHNPAMTTNRRYSINTAGDDLTDALMLYMQDIPEYILRAFNLTVEDLESGVASFLELADVDELKDRRDLMMEGKIMPDMPEFDETFSDYKNKFAKEQAELERAAATIGRGTAMYDAIDYYTKLKFVFDCLSGTVAVDNFGTGKLDDLGVSFLTSAECILSVLYAEYGNNPTREQAENFIFYIEGSNLIDIKRIFRIRDQAFKGYKVDFGKYRECRACDNTWIWAYCTKVFREASNAPIEKQRPYLMELVILENCNKYDKTLRSVMKECVRIALEELNLDNTAYAPYGNLESYSDKVCSFKSIDWIAATLFFSIRAGKIKDEPIDDNYKITVQSEDGSDITVNIPVAVYNLIKQFNIEAHKRYMTVYDFCKHEFNPNTTVGSFNICLVNANVDPWHVKPKKGFVIKSYALLPNYYDADSLDKVNGENFYQLAVQNGGITVNPLKGFYKSVFLPTMEFEELLQLEKEVRSCEDVEDLSYFLSPTVFEPIFAYIRRWALEKKRAKALGKKLVSIPLKQDRVYRDLAYFYCDEIPVQEAVYTTDNISVQAAQTVTDVKVISWKDFTETNMAITNKSFKIYPMTIKDLNNCDPNDIQDILSGEWYSSVDVTVTGNYINYFAGEVIRVAVPTLTMNEINSFVDAGILKSIGSNLYFLRAKNGDYIVEVNV